MNLQGVQNSPITVTVTMMCDLPFSISFTHECTEEVFTSRVISQEAEYRNR